MSESLSATRFRVHDGDESHLPQLIEDLEHVVFGVFRQRMPIAFLIAAGRECFDGERISLGRGKGFFEEGSEDTALRLVELSDRRCILLRFFNHEFCSGMNSARA